MEARRQRGAVGGGAQAAGPRREEVGALWPALLLLMLKGCGQM